MNRNNPTSIPTSYTTIPGVIVEQGIFKDMLVYFEIHTLEYSCIRILMLNIINIDDCLLYDYKSYSR